MTAARGGRAPKREAITSCRAVRGKTTIDRPKRHFDQEMFMKRLMSHLYTQVRKTWNRPTSRLQRFTKLKLEGLEDRLVPSTTEVVLQGLYGFESFGIYGDFWSAYNAAQPGDTIQLQQGANIPGGTFNKPSLTIQGDPSFGARNYSVTGQVDVTLDGRGTTFKNLDFSQANLTTENTDAVSVENSILGTATFQGSFLNTLYSNSIEGPIFFVGQSGFNSVEANVFRGNGQLVMDGGLADAVFYNEFLTSGGNSAIVLGSEQATEVEYNQISVTGSPGNIGSGIVVVNDQGAQGTGVQIIGNYIQSGNLGVGLLIDNHAGSDNTSVWAQDNNFGGNALGVEVVGDGQNAGDINLGGENGNPGGNDFSDYQGNDGRLALAMVNTNNNATIWANNNTWGTWYPNVIKDAYNNTYLNPVGDYYGSLPGSGVV
jgi:hypothetical protein